MSQPVPPLIPSGRSDNSDTEIIIEQVTSDFPPKKRKIDPSTIRWPEGEPKPWEKPQLPEAGT